MIFSWKKMVIPSLAVCLLQTNPCFSFSLSFLTHSSSATEQKNEPTAAPVSTTEMSELTDAIKAIHKNYIFNVSDKTLFDNAINGMVTRLDPHSAFLDKEAMSDLETTVSGEFVGIGIELTTDHGLLKVISPIDGTPAAKAGIKPGDLIVKVGSKLIQDMTISEAVNYIKGKPGTPVTLTIMRKNKEKPLIVKLMRETVKVKAVESKMLMPQYGYIRLSVFQGPVAQQIKEAIEQLKADSPNNELKGLVLDLRNNPGGLLDVSADVVDLFLDKNPTGKFKNLIVYTKGRIADSDSAFYAHENDIIPHVPMAVLINNGTASASEIVSGALQDYKRAIIMGTRSFGKGSVQTIYPLTRDSAIKLTTALYYTPSGREIQARGIEPDIIVPDLSVDEKQANSLMDVDEKNYDNHILNHADASIKTALTGQQTQPSEIELAKKDYQLYEALMMLKGMHALR